MMRSLSRCSLVLGTVLLTGVQSANAQAVDRHMFGWTFGNQVDLLLNGNLVVSSRDRGWYRQDGNHQSFDTGYIVGVCGTTCFGNGETYRNWATFNIPTGITIASATLRLFNPGANPSNLGYRSPNASETFTLYDVSTSISTLESTNVGQVGIYNDLGTGTSYGERVVSAADNNTLVSVGLNAAAVSALQASTGQAWAVGGTLFNPTSVVPEPSTYALLASGLAVLSFAAKRRRVR